MRWRRSTISTLKVEFETGRDSPLVRYMGVRAELFVAMLVVANVLIERGTDVPLQLLDELCDDEAGVVAKRIAERDLRAAVQTLAASDQELAARLMDGW